MKNKIAIIIPAHNEEKIIAKTLLSLLNVVDQNDIYFVDDCSTDNTLSIAKKYINSNHILALSFHRGKAQAINIALNVFNLKDRYLYIFPLDADTKIEPDFINQTLKVFKKDEKIVAVVGKIQGKIKSWITTYRLWEYEIGQTIHKKAQEKENAILVCSGCTTIYKSSLFDKLDFSLDTLTEDMDMTFNIHRENLGKIAFCEKAVAQTQDPLTLLNYIKQIERWFIGFWQCVYKHKVPFGKQHLDFEVSLNAIDGLFGGFVILGLILLAPWLIVHNPGLLFSAFLIDLSIFFLLFMLMIVLKFKTYKFIKYLLPFYFLRIISGIIFLKAYFKTIFGLDKINWNKVDRYYL